MAGLTFAADLNHIIMSSHVAMCHHHSNDDEPSPIGKLIIPLYIIAHAHDVLSMRETLKCDRFNSCHVISYEKVTTKVKRSYLYSSTAYRTMITLLASPSVHFYLIS
jgi:hypothetical protein